MKSDEFTYTLERLLRSARLVNWPRRRTQKDVLIASVALMFIDGQTYSEIDVNETINEWLDLVGKSVQIDHANIRRALVDEGYLSRDSSGSVYSFTDHLHNVHGSDVADLNIRAVLRKS